MHSRRDFLKESMVGVGAVSLGMPGYSSLAHAAENSRPSKLQLALQLYSVRNEVAKDMHGTLAKVKSLGYDYVETAFFPKEVSVQQARSALKTAGLKVCSIHAELPDGAQKGIWLEMADSYSCRRIIWHGWPESDLFKSEDGIKQLADIYNAANAFAKSHGLTFGLHNHWWEFAPHADGRLPMEILAQFIDKDIFFQIDTYWTKVSGQDPEKIVSKFADRTLAMHFKDGPAKTPRESMVAVGSGTQDFPAIVRASSGHVEWLIVELDICDTDIFEALRQSREYLIGKGLVTQT